MFISAEEFSDQEHKAVTVMGMSGVGKTTLAAALDEHGWFHYSVDYRIGTEYINKAIMETVQEKVEQDSYTSKLLGRGVILIHNNITIDNISPIASFLAMIGNPEKGGLTKDEFLRRQRLYREAEEKSSFDLPGFIEKAQSQYGKQHILNDTAGSLCELDNKEILDLLAAHSVMVYIKATDKDEKELFERAMESPKPLLYNEAFFETALEEYMTEKDLEYVALIEPDDMYRFMLPKLFQARLPKYQAIADEYGYIISTEELRGIKTEEDFLGVISEAIGRRTE